MRTTIALDDDVLEVVRDYATIKKLSLGRAVTDLLRQGIAAAPPMRIVNGLAVLILPGLAGNHHGAGQEVAGRGILVPSFLLDVNVLLSLSWPSHRHHIEAMSWFKNKAIHGWATCPFTQTAFIRLSCNPSFSKDALTPAKAQLLLDTSLDHPNHQFWPDELSVRDALAPLRQKIVGHRQITDAYLLGLTIFRQGKLATFDAAISSLLPTEKLRLASIEQL